MLSKDDAQVQLGLGVCGDGLLGGSQYQEKPEGRGSGCDGRRFETSSSDGLLRRVRKGSESPLP
eukprot:5876407-Pleurochrysis_carterae.AAC.1